MTSFATERVAPKPPGFAGGSLVVVVVVCFSHHPQPFHLPLLLPLQALRCLKLYLERLGCVFGPDGTCKNQEGIQDCLDLVARAVTDGEFLNYRPTITAAAVLYCERLHKGQLPFWPSSLSGLTSYSNARTPELSAAIGGAQRLWKQLATARRKASGAGDDASGTEADVAAAADKVSEQGAQAEAADVSSGGQEAAGSGSGDQPASGDQAVEDAAAQLAATKI